MKNLIAFLLIITQSFKLSAQVYVIDAENQEPVFHAILIDAEKNKMIEISHNGYFSQTFPNVWQIRAIGFKSVQSRKAIRQGDTVFLNPVQDTLLESTVSATTSTLAENLNRAFKSHNRLHLSAPVHQDIAYDFKSEVYCGNDTVASMYGFSVLTFNNHKKKKLEGFYYPYKNLTLKIDTSNRIWNFHQNPFWLIFNRNPLARSKIGKEVYRKHQKEERKDLFLDTLIDSEIKQKTIVQEDSTENTWVLFYGKFPFSIFRKTYKLEGESFDSLRFREITHEDVFRENDLLRYTSVTWYYSDFLYPDSMIAEALSHHRDSNINFIERMTLRNPEITEALPKEAKFKFKSYSHKAFSRLEKSIEVQFK